MALLGTRNQMVIIPEVGLAHNSKTGSAREKMSITLLILLMSSTKKYICTKAKDDSL